MTDGKKRVEERKKEGGREEGRAKREREREKRERERERERERKRGFEILTKTARKKKREE